MDHSLATGQKGDAAAVSGMGFQDRCQEGAGFLCLAAKLIGQVDRLIAQFPAGYRGAGTQLANAANDL